MCSREKVNPAYEHLPEMVAMAGRGYSTKIIGDKFGASAATVRRWLIENGVDLGPPGRKLSITNDYVELCVSMREQGVGWIEVSEKIGFSARQLQRRLQIARQQ